MTYTQETKVGCVMVLFLCLAALAFSLYAAYLAVSYTPQHTKDYYNARRGL
jgi:hypothetical protein